MSATELAERIQQNVEAGQWAQAMATLADAWKDASDFGVVPCGLPDYADVWVRFKTSGYPFALRRQWEQANDDQAIYGLVLPRIVAWNVRDVDGNPVELPAEEGRTLALLDNVEDALAAWIVRAFFLFWRRDLSGPRKN